MSSLWSWKTHKHGKTVKGIQRFKYPHCDQTFPENLNTLYYNRHLSSDEVYTILQSHVEGNSLRGVSRITGRAYGTVVSLIIDASNKAQTANLGIQMTGVVTKDYWAKNMSIILEKIAPQRLERTNGIIRQKTGRWHRRQNKFGKMWS